MMTEIVVAGIAGLSAVIGAWLTSRKTHRTVTAMRADMRPNGGSSLRDAVDRIERTLVIVAESQTDDRRRLDRACERVEGLAQTIAQYHR
jgi:hypothetical protein